jgi:ribonuclease HIII
MNSAELKLNLFRKIDNLKDSEIEKIYDQFMELINSTSSYSLSAEEKNAVADALVQSKNGETCTHDEVVEEAKKKYPDLRFK